MNKKRFFILTICLFALTLSSYAQGKVSTQSYTLKFGVKAGVNFANISNGSDINFSPGMKTDFHAGAAANFHFGRRNEGSPAGTGMFGLQPEILYSRQGFIFNEEAYNFNYFMIPVMFKLYFVEGINIEAGPYFNYLFGISPNSTVINGAQISLSNLKGGMDVGLGIGAGYEMKSGLSIGARYSIGLSDMSNNLAWKNNVIALSVAWFF